jgi:hypothetical protein
VFWTEIGNVQRMNLDTNNTNTLARRQAYLGAITLDYIDKRVYWIEQDRNSVEHIFSSDYHFQQLKNIRNGSFSFYMLAIFGGSLYFQQEDVFSINQLNVSNGNSVRSILVGKATYYGLIVVDRSLHPMGM